MDAAHHVFPNLDQLDLTALKALIVAQQEQILSHKNEIEHLKLLIAKLRRMQFGRSSEKLNRQIEQLELRLEALQMNEAESIATQVLREPAAMGASVARSVRRPLPAHLPRETRTYLPRQESCPDCGGKLKQLGEDVSEVLEIEPLRFKVIRQVCPKLACAGWDKIVQSDARSRPIERGVAGPGGLAHLLGSKDSDHLPPHRPAAIYAPVSVV